MRLIKAGTGSVKFSQRNEEKLQNKTGKTKQKVDDCVINRTNLHRSTNVNTSNGDSRSRQKQAGGSAGKLYP